MSHPDPLFDDYNDYYGENMDYSDYNDDVFEMDGMECGHEDGFEDENSGEADWDYDDSMDGDHDSSMNSIGWDVDEGYGHYGEDY